LTNKVL